MIGVKLLMHAQKDPKQDLLIMVVILIVILKNGNIKNIVLIKNYAIFFIYKYVIIIFFYYTSRNRGGEYHLGVFASKNIEANTELCYDYNFSWFDDTESIGQACFCGSENCRGYLGKKHKK